MWLTILTTLLLSTARAASDEVIHFTLKELHNQVSTAAQTANDLFLESEMLNGRLDLVKEVLGDNLQMFEEYSQMDISSGIPEQNEVLELVDKAETSRTSNEERKNIEKGFEALDSLEGFNRPYDKLGGIPDELKTIEKSSEFEKAFTIEWNKKLAELSRAFYTIHRTEHYRSITHRYGGEKQEKRKNAHRYHAAACDQINDIIHNFYMFIEGLSIGSLSLNVIKFLTGLVDVPVIGKIKSLENLGQDLTSMETEMKILEELRDSTAPEQIQTVTKKLESTMNQIPVAENVESKYKRIESASKLLQKISLFTSFLSTIKWKFEYFKKKWGPVEEHLNNLKIPSEDLSKSFVGLRDCISQHDFSIYSTLHEKEMKKVAEQIKRIHSLLREFREAYHRLIQFEDWAAYKQKLYDARNRLEKAKWSDEDWEKFVTETLIHFDQQKWQYVVDKLRRREDWPINPGVYMSTYEAIIRELGQISKAIDVETVKKVTNNIKIVIDSIYPFLRCYSDLKVTPETIKSSMDQSLEAWKFDPRPLESVLAVIDLFKDAHKMIGGLTSFKFEENDVIKHFPLTREDVTGISEGVEALGAILKVQSGWRILRESMEDSDVKDALIQFSEELSHLEMNPKIPEIQEFLSKIQFPKDFDTVIDFYKNRYQGRRRRDILKILEGFKTMDFPSYPLKLENMNEDIRLMKWWAEREGIGGPVEEKPWVDCALSTCEHVLKLPETPEDPEVS